MAVDITLVLPSEHRHLQQLVERCGRTTRGFHDPSADLQQALRAHVLAAAAEVYPIAAQKSVGSGWPAEQLCEVRRVAENPTAAADELVGTTGNLVRVELEFVVPALESLEQLARRRMGKVFRMRRDANLRNSEGGARRRRSQTELYEMARRAGVEHRSRMTQAQLQEALAERGLDN